MKKTPSTFLTITKKEAIWFKFFLNSIPKTWHSQLFEYYEYIKKKSSTLMWYLLFSSAPISIWGVQELDTFKNSQISYLHPEVKTSTA